MCVYNVLCDAKRPTKGATECEIFNGSWDIKDVCV